MWFYFHFILTGTFAFILFTLENFGPWDFSNITKESLLNSSNSDPVFIPLQLHYP